MIICLITIISPEHKWMMSTWWYQNDDVIILLTSTWCKHSQMVTPVRNSISHHIYHLLLWVYDVSMIVFKWWHQHLVYVNILQMATSVNDVPETKPFAMVNITCIATWRHVTSLATLVTLPSNVTSSCDVITSRHFRSKIWREHWPLVLAYTTGMV